MIATYIDPGLLWLDDEPEPDPVDAEILTVSAGLIWWSAPTATDDEDTIMSNTIDPADGLPITEVRITATVTPRGAAVAALVRLRSQLAALSPADRGAVRPLLDELVADQCELAWCAFGEMLANQEPQS
jgi:hypothetical protein